MLDLRNIEYAYENTPVLHDLSVRIWRGEILTVLGPSGCGKTTLLRLIAGLERPDAGEILLDGKSLINEPVHSRGFGFMFQEYALFPHMDVAQNIEFGLKMRGVDKKARKERIAELTQLVGLEGYEKRKINQLSGGQRQRVALARSLAPNPRILLLDEPMGSLDTTLRYHLLGELRKIIKNLSLTAVYVTHDQQEAFAMGDRVAVMNAGQIEQITKPQELFRHPRTVFTAQFLGLPNIVPITERHNGTVTTPIGDLQLSAEADAVLIHPEEIYLNQPSLTYSIPGTVTDQLFQGYKIELTIEVNKSASFTLQVRSKGSYIPALGEEVMLCFEDDAIIPLQE